MLKWNIGNIQKAMELMLIMNWRGKTDTTNKLQDVEDNEIEYEEYYAEDLQNRIDKDLNFIDCHFKEMVADEEAQELKSILKESGE